MLTCILCVMACFSLDSGSSWSRGVWLMSHATTAMCWCVQFKQYCCIYAARTCRIYFTPFRTTFDYCFQVITNYRPLPPPNRTYLRHPPYPGAHLFWNMMNTATKKVPTTKGTHGGIYSSSIALLCLRFWDKSVLFFLTTSWRWKSDGLPRVQRSRGRLYKRRTAPPWRLLKRRASLRNACSLERRRRRVLQRVTHRVRRSRPAAPGADLSRRRRLLPGHPPTRCR